jgi:hypothetical protein
MHPPNIYKGHNTKDAKHWEWLQEDHGKTIYMQEVDPNVPNSVRFPLEQAQELSGVKMFSSTFAYMSALAVMQGYEEIQIYGVELSSSEYHYQANSYLFWFGFLRGKLGDKVSNTVTYLDNNIFDAPLYGYEGNFSFGAEYFAERATLLNNRWESAEKHFVNMKKAIEKAIKDYDFENVQRLTLEYQSAALKGGELAGALAEAERYQKFGDRFADRGGFERMASKSQQDGDQKRPMIWHYGGMVEYAWNVWKQTKSKPAELQMIKFIETMGQVAYDTGALLGAYKENVLYINKYDATADAGGAVLLENNA